MDIKQNILERMIKICEKKNVNPDIFHRKKSLSRYKSEIQKGYTDIISTFLTGVPIHKTSINNKKVEDAKLCFEGAFEKYLEEIKRNYPKKIWEMKKISAKKCPR